MKLEKKEETKKVVKEMPEDEYQKYTCGIVENAEANLSLQEVQGKIIEKLAYTFPQRGQTIQGLTFWGLKSCAQAGKQKWTPVFSKPEYQNMPADRVLVSISCTNEVSGEVEYGACIFNPTERFGERIALTNAKRFALDKLISLAQKMSFIKYIFTKKPEAVMQLKVPTPAEEKKEITPSDEKMKFVSAIYAKINNLKFDTKKSILYFKNKYRIEHFQELKFQQLQEIVNILANAEIDNSAKVDLNLAIHEEAK